MDHIPLVLPKGREGIPEKVLRFLSALSPDKAWELVVRERKPRRSEQQNRYLYGVVYKTILDVGGEAMRGWTKDDLHEFFLGEHFGWETTEGFGRKRLKPVRRSSRLNKQEFSDYIAFIQRFMADKGVYIPDANEYLAEAAGAADDDDDERQVA